ncbi:MAG: hypothetical protein HY245_13610 [Rhizobiales bacterium]|nr:hypothetical protein [Hyphomicrobiales bacterium]MBI3674427.1 hypothetical protein [Hyphomicrobiales bacterium]
MRTSRKTVTFDKPFKFAGLDGPQPAGAYIVVTEEEPIPGLSFESWRRVKTSLRLPAIGRDTGWEQAITINPQDLADALTKDGKSSA